MSRVSKVNDCVRDFTSKGGYVTKAGMPIGIKGEIRSPKLSGRGNCRYLAINLKHPSTKSVMPTPLHKIVAYLKFGEDAFDSPCIRHLDGSHLNNSWDNIALGSHSDNALDRPKRERRLHARKAGRANSLSEEKWSIIRADYASGMGYKKLSKKYGVAPSTLSYRLSNTAKRREAKL